MRSSHSAPGPVQRHGPRRLLLVAAAILASALAVAPAAAQLEDNLASYTDETAEGYLKPLAEAFGQTLNTGFFTSAAIPRDGFRVRLEVHAMSVFFNKDAWNQLPDDLKWVVKIAAKETQLWSHAWQEQLNIEAIKRFKKKIEFVRMDKDAITSFAKRTWSWARILRL